MVLHLRPRRCGSPPAVNGIFAVVGQRRAGRRGGRGVVVNCRCRDDRRELTEVQRQVVEGGHRDRDEVVAVPRSHPTGSPAAWCTRCTDARRGRAASPCPSARRGSGPRCWCRRSPGRRSMRPGSPSVTTATDASVDDLDVGDLAVAEEAGPARWPRRALAASTFARALVLERSPDDGIQMPPAMVVRVDEGQAGGDVARASSTSASRPSAHPHLGEPAVGVEPFAACWRPTPDPVRQNCSSPGTARGSRVVDLPAPPPRAW